MRVRAEQSTDLHVDESRKSAAPYPEVREQRVRHGLRGAGKRQVRGVLAGVRDKLVEDHERGAGACGNAQVLHNLFYLRVGPVVRDEAQDVCRGAFDGLRIEKVVTWTARRPR